MIAGIFNRSSRVRMTIIKGVFQCAVLLLLFCASNESSFAKDTTRILFIGNSYTGQIRGTLISLFKASPRGRSIEMEFITPGGKTLEAHLKNETISKIIAEGNWDYVILQDQSQTPAVYPKRFESAAIKLDKLIDAAGAKTVFYQTWGRRDGDKQNAKRFPSYKAMQKALSKSYATTARRCNAILVPVGDTWALVRKSDVDLGKALYASDGSHPSGKGAYLAACVFYASIFRQSPQAINFRGGVSDSEAALILKSVRQTTGK